VRRRVSGTGSQLYVVAGLIIIFLGSCTQAHEGKSATFAKIGPELSTLYDRYSAALASNPGAPFRSTNPLVHIIEDRVIIDAVASGDVDTLKADLMSLGMKQAVTFGRIVSGQLPIAAIPDLARLPSLNFARAAAAIMQQER
jgi:hypothetical protein